MSTTIDNKVVEMRFDNKQFESNVKTTMSTLDKLKQKLNFSGASKGLENISVAAKKTDMSGLANGIDTVNAKFSALQVAGVTALVNITNQAVNAGKKMVSSLTVDPIMDGFREYELKLGSVQTILANTESKGTTLDDVTAALQELNEYADQTIYNFAEMTRNIGTFTAAGVDLDTSVTSIKGIANLAAVSGSTSQQASVAMYQLSQALAAGKVSLMDWNSVVNAGMGGEVFQNALKRTATQMGTNVDAIIEKYGSFRESLTQGEWLTTEVLTETLTQLSGAYTEADLIAQGYTEEQARDIVKLAETATDAATKVKTFTQLMDTMKEAAGSGWAQTWEIMLGDFEEAKEFFTGLSDYFGEMINGSAEARNSLLEGAFSSNWEKLGAEIEKAGIPLGTFNDKLKEVAKEHNIDIDKMIEDQGSLAKVMESGSVSGDIIIETMKKFSGETDALNESTTAMTDKLEYFQKVVDETWHGDWLNGEDRIKKLTEAGYDYNEVQRLVNLTEDGRRLTLEDLNEEEMKAIGFTEEQVAALQELAKQAEETGTPINELINNLSKPSGRFLFLDSITNILKAIMEPLRAVKRAFNEVFAIESNQLYNAIDGFHRFTEAIVISEETAGQLTSTFKGLFSIFKIFTTIFGGAFGLAFTAITNVLERFDLNILEVTAALGEIIYAFVDTITFGETFTKVIEFIKPAIVSVLGPLAKFFKSFAELPAIQSAIKPIRDFFDSISGYFSKFKDMTVSDIIGTLFSDITSFFSNLSWGSVLSGLSSFGETIRNVFSTIVSEASTIGPDIISGLRNGLSGGVETVLGIMRDIGSKIIEAIKAVLGIHSPSTEMFEVGQNIIEGLLNGLQSLLSNIWGFIKGLAQGILDFFGDLDLGSLVMIGMGAGLLFVFNKLANAFSALTAPLEGVGDVLESASKAIDAFSGTLKGLKTAIKAQALKSLAIAIAILVGSIVVLTMLDTAKVWMSVGVIVVLAGVLAGLSIAISKFTQTSSVDAVKMAGILLSVGVALLAFAGVMFIISNISWEGLGKAGAALVGLGVVVGALIVVTSKWKEGDLSKAARFVTKVSTAFLILSAAIWIISGISWENLGKAGAALAGFGIVIGALIAIIHFSKGLDKAVLMIGQIGAAFLLMALAVKLLGGMEEGDIDKARAAITGFGLIIVALMAATKLLGGKAKSITAIGTTVLGMAGAILMLALAAKLISGMDPNDMAKAVVGIGFLGLIVAGLVAVTNKAGGGKKLERVGTTLLMMAVAVGILAGVAVILGLVDPANLAKGVVAVGFLGVIVSMMAVAAGKAKNVKGTMIAMTVAIGILSASLIALTFIDPAKLAGATLALSVVLGMFGLVVAATGKMKKAMSTLIVLTVAIGLIAGALYLLSGLPVQSTIGNAVAISTVLLALAGACKILDSVKSISKSVMKTMGILTAVVAGIAVILGLMSFLNLEASLTNVIAISALLLAMSGACVILGTIKSVSKSAITAVNALLPIVAGIAAILGIMALLNAQASLQSAVAISAVLLAMSGACVILSTIKAISPAATGAMTSLLIIVGGLALILGLMSAFDVAPSLETALALSVMLLAMSGAMVILSALGPMAAGAIATAGSMAAVLGILAAVVLAAGAIKQIPGVDWLVSEGGELLQKIGEAIGKFIGGFVGGVLDGLTDNLVGVADNLSNFITHLMPFLVGVKMIDPSTQTAIDSLVGMILSLTGASFITAITDFLGIGTDFGALGEKLVPFGEAMQKYSAAVSGIDAEAVAASATAGEALAKLASTLPKEGGLAQAIFGENVDMATFGEQILTFGNAIKAYSVAVSGIDSEAISASATAGQALSDLASTLPKEGGLSQAIFGENADLGTFGAQLITFGMGLRMYAASVAGLDVESIQNSVAAGQALSDLAQALPEEDGWLENIFSGGSTSLDEFGTQLSSFGSALSEYSNSLSGVDFENVGTATTQVNRIKTMINSLVDMDTSGVTKLSNIKTIGDYIKTYSEKVENVGNVESSITAVRNLMDLITDMAGLDDSGVSTFKSAMETLGSVEVGNFVAAFNEAASQMVSVGQNIISSLINGLTSGMVGLNSAALNMVLTMTTAIESQESVFSTAGTDITTKISEGVDNGSSNVSDSVRSMLTSAASTMDGYYTWFFNAGCNLAIGFANGISSSAYMARVNAEAMANAAAQAARDALDINSPSKVFMGIGGSVPEGFAKGIDKFGYFVRNSTESMTDTALRGTKNAISRIADVVNSDIEASRPTIRPVLDLTNVESGARALNGMFSMAPSVGVLGNVNGINAMMNRRLQNGANDDVVDAIGKLRNDVGNLSTNSYTINGITYDGGSEVANAIETLTRYAIMERRV